MAKVALLIGVGQYRQPSEFKNLAATGADVAAMRQVLVQLEIGGFAEADVTTLLNPEPQQMREALDRLFADRRPDDLLVVYFSGHGVVDDRGKFHLTSACTEKGLLNSTAIPATYLHELMESSRSKRQVLILDCCFSGAFAKGMAAKGDAVNLQVQLGGRGRAVLTSSSATEYSFEHKESALSVYTQYVVEGLRSPRQKAQKLWDWRREAPIRPIVFRDPGSLDGQVVHLHLEHRIVQRLLGRFLSQGFLHNELTRACVCRTDDPIPRVLILGRLSLYGNRAARLHDEIISVAADWIDPEARGRGRLRPLGETEKKDVMQILEDSLTHPRLRDVPPAIVDRLKAHTARDVEDLLTHLKRRATELTDRAKRKLEQRGEREAAEMKTLLEEQRDRILKQVKQYETQQLSLFNADEMRQINADRQHWEKRVGELETEILGEPERIQQTYHVKAERIEPVGIIYLYPVSN